MKYIHKFIGATFMTTLTLLFGCNKFSEINTNPDTTTEVSASMLCSGIILGIAEFSGKDAKAYIAEDALSKYVGYANEGQMAEQYNLLGSSSFGSMTILPNIDQMLVYSKGGIMDSSYQGVAKFARAYLFYKLTMEMGDVPYSEASKGADGLYKPKYDLQEDIFKGILDDLKSADQYFANGTHFTGDPTPYNGDPVKWREATNTFALKVLMTLSNKESNANLNVKSRFSEIFSANHLITNPNDFFGLVYSTLNQHPLSGTNDLFTSRTVISSLLIDSLKKLNDRRMFYFAEPAGAQITAGKTSDDPDAYVGVDVSMDYAAMNANYSANKYSLLNKRYLMEVASEPRMLITYAEQQLIIAEAIERGWITGSAEDYYKEGVKSALAATMATNGSYAHGMTIDQNYIANYFTGEAAFKTTTEEQLQQIWMQRYLLNFMQDAESAYFEYRRTGYPVFPINPATSLNVNNPNGLPMRWLYPGSETNYNRANLIEALNRQYDGFDEINKLMWLLK